MEVDPRRRTEWELLFFVAGRVIEQWLTADQREQFDWTRRLDTDSEQAVEMYRVLTDRYFTDWQRRFADRYGRDPERLRENRSPWPAPEPVPDTTIRALVDEMMEEPSSTRARTAQLLLMIAACIEAANEMETRIARSGR